MLRLTLLALSSTGLVAGCASTQLEPVASIEEIPWSTDRPLRWDDFLGIVDPHAPTERVAITAASIRWGYEYRIERNSGDCAYRITSIHSEATFGPRDSWVRPDYRNAAVLIHEQGHFDLTHIYERMFAERAAELIGVRNSCEGSTLKEASRFTEQRAAALVEAVFDDIWQGLTATQAAYDDQTRHGIETDSQTLWTERIRRGLQTGTWQMNRNRSLSSP